MRDTERGVGLQESDRKRMVFCSYAPYKNILNGSSYEYCHYSLHYVR